MRTLFMTIHGSHLYGLSHEASDVDYFRVVEKQPHMTKKRLDTHIITGPLDIQTVDLTTWLEDCRRGSPKALEAMFSTQPMVDTIQYLRASYRPPSQPWPMYARIMENYRDKDETVKSKVHMLRLATNYRALVKDGWFNPTLPQYKVDTYREVAECSTNDEVFVTATRLAWNGYDVLH